MQCRSGLTQVIGDEYIAYNLGACVSIGLLYMTDRRGMQNYSGKISSWHGVLCTEADAS